MQITLLLCDSRVRAEKRDIKMEQMWGHFKLLPHASTWWGFAGTSSCWAKSGRGWKRNHFCHHLLQMSSPDTRLFPCPYTSCSLIPGTPCSFLFTAFSPIWPPLAERFVLFSSTDLNRESRLRKSSPAENKIMRGNLNLCYRLFTKIPKAECDGVQVGARK